MDQVHVIRHKVLVEGHSVRSVARQMGVGRNTVRKYLKVSEPVRVERQKKPSPVTETVGPKSTSVHSTNVIPTEGYVCEVLDQSEQVEADLKEDIRYKRGDLLGNGRPMETYRRLSVDEALARL